MKRQNHLFKIEDDQLKSLCDRLPLRKPDRRIAYALSVLCSRSGSYAPDHGVGQSEIARLAGLGVRTVQRRIKYLSRYGILSIRRETGRANVYQFDLVMLFDAPAATHDIYKRIKAEPARPVAPLEPVAESLPLFDRGETPADPETVTPQPATGLPFLERIHRAAGCLFSRFTKRTNTSEEKETTAKTAAISEQTPAKPTPNRRHLERNPRHFSGSAPKTAATSDETTAKPPPLSAEPTPNRRQTAAIFPPFHSPSNSKEPEIKNSTSKFQFHGGGDLKIDSDFESEPAADPHSGFHLPSRKFKKPDPAPPEPPPPDPSAPGVRRVMWPRSIRNEDLKDPLALQELYEVAVEQGFFLDLDTARLNFFALARYCSRAAKIENKIGLFSSNVDRTVKDRFGKPFEEKLTQADEEWARLAIKNMDFPALTSVQERLNQP